MKKTIFVTQSSMPDYQEYCEEIKSIWKNYHLTNMGPKHQQLQKLLRDYLDISQIELFTNGHMALELSLQALQLQGEVITTPFTFASTTQAIVRNGLEPVFCDVNPDDYTIDASKIESLITPRTCAIMPVHVYGSVCDVEQIQAIAQKHGLKVIYDAAHTFGVRYKGRGIGEYGDVSCFSFHATKVFNTIEGGAVVYHNEEVGRRLRNLRNFGMDTGESFPDIGLNAKMNEFCAAMGICNFRHIDGEIEKRRRVVAHYRSRLSEISGLKLIPIQQNVIPNYAYFPVIFQKNIFGATRDQVQEALAEKSIYARKYFFPLTSRLQCYCHKFEIQATPVAEFLSQNVLTLPLYSDLLLDEVDEICDLIIKCGNARKGV